MSRIHGLVLLAALSNTPQVVAQPPGRPVGQPPAPAGEAPVTLGQVGDYPVGLTGGGHSRWTLLHLPSVQDELRLTPEQKARFASIIDELRRRQQQIQQEFMDHRKEVEQQGDAQALRELARIRQRSLSAVSQETEAFLPAKVLDRQQRARLEQIRTQAMGPDAFNSRDVQERLNLAPEQIAEIEEIVARWRQESRLATVLPAGSVPGDFRSLSAEKTRELVQSKAYSQAVRGARSAAGKLRSTTMQRIVRLLSKGQRKRYQKMIGEPFDFTRTSTSSLRDAVDFTRTSTSSPRDAPRAGEPASGGKPR